MMSPVAISLLVRVKGHREVLDSGTEQPSRTTED